MTNLIIFATKFFITDNNNSSSELDTLVNCIVAVAMSLKSSIHAFGKFYYENIILLYDDQNRHKFTSPCIFRVFLIMFRHAFFFFKHIK